MLPNDVTALGQPTTATATVDHSGEYNATNPAWVVFSAGIDTQLMGMEEQFRDYWTMRAVRTSLGR